MSVPIYTRMLCEALTKRLSYLVTEGRQFDNVLEKLLRVGIRAFEIEGIIVQSKPFNIITSNTEPEFSKPIYAFLIQFATVAAEDPESMLLGEKIGEEGLTKFTLPTMRVDCDFTEIVGRRRRRMVEDDQRLHSRDSIKTFPKVMEKLGMPDPNPE